MKKKNLVLTMFALALVGLLSACSKDNATTKSSSTETKADDKLDYAYGEDVTFHSNEPVTYTMMFSDHENYPYKEDWLLWKTIKEKTNVDFNLTIVARTDYNDKVSAAVNSGSAPYIIPKIYDSSAYEDSGQVVAISDWVQYMPNYQKAVKNWGLQADLNQILTADGKYYRLPGMWENNAGGYSLAIRKDIFEAAGVDLSNEAKWTWDDFIEALKKVKTYTGADYVWSDGFQFGSTMNIAASAYGVTGGYSSDGGDWGLKNGIKFDQEKKEFYFADTTENYKEYLKLLHTLYEEKLLDPETFTQDTATARAKFYRGDSYVLNMNYQILSDTLNGKMTVDNYELYFLTPPMGKAGNIKISSNSGRLENGIMISQNALKELGEEKFIKMLRFIDWLWYSDEGQTLCLWGVEGETYTLDSNKNFVLNPDIYFNGINPGAPKQLNVDYGFGGGVFAYGGSKKLRYSKFSEGETQWNNRVDENRVDQVLTPPILADELQKEDLNLIQVSLMDYVNTSALEFISGKKSLDTDWDSYVAECENKGSTKYVKLANEIYQKTKSLLGE
jgi:hypothetical protein